MPLVSLLPFLQGKPFLSSHTKSLVQVWWTSGDDFGTHLIKVLSGGSKPTKTQLGREGRVLMPTMLSLHTLQKLLGLQPRVPNFVYLCNSGEGREVELC